MKIHLGGSLAWHDRQKRSWVDVPLDGAATLRGLLEQMAVPCAEVAFAVVNGTLVTDLDTRVGEADDVRFYPMIGGG